GGEGLFAVAHDLRHGLLQGFQDALLQLQQLVALLEQPFIQRLLPVQSAAFIRRLFADVLKTGRHRDAHVAKEVGQRNADTTSAHAAAASFPMSRSISPSFSNRRTTSMILFWASSISFNFTDPMKLIS